MVPQPEIKIALDDRHLIELLEGPPKVTKKLGLPNTSRPMVSMWHVRNLIPDAWRNKLADLASAEGIAVAENFREPAMLRQRQTA